MCHQSFAIDSQLDTHICHTSQDIDTKPLICLRCNEAFPTMKALTVHNRDECMGGWKLDNVNTKDGHNLRTPKTYSCDLCGMTYGALYDLKSHHLEQHSGENFPFECETCGKSFLVKSKLEIHNLKHLSFDFSTPVTMEEITAGVNDVLEDSKLLMPPPMSRTPHINKGNFTCPICDAVFVLEHRLNTHLATVHRPCSACVNLSRCRCGVSPSKFTCDVCGQQYTKEMTLKKHMALHSGKDKRHMHCE